MGVCLASGLTVHAAVRQVKAAGGRVDMNLSAGHVTCYDPDGAVVYRAIRKGQGWQPWIVRYTDTPLFKWRNDSGQA